MPILPPAPAGAERAGLRVREGSGAWNLVGNIPGREES